MSLMSVGTWSKEQAFEHLQKEAYNPSRTHRELHHAVTEGEKVTKDVAIAVAAAILAPALVVTLPAFTALVAGVGIAGAAELLSGVGQELYEGFRDSKDLPTKVSGSELPVLLRSNIMSILHNKSLRELAGDRRGTRGTVYIKDALEGIVPHYIAAKRNWKGGQQYSVKSCQDAENLYRMFAETDYHLSKMSAYAKQLAKFANAYVQFCDTNALKVKHAYEEAKGKINTVLNYDEDWHKRNCHVTDHCYRTHKASRMFTKKAA